jgi:hypothetical protein
MMNNYDRLPSRRRILMGGAFAAACLVPPMDDAFAQQQGLAPTPSCHDGDEPTIPEIEGPFFKPRSARRSDLREPGIAGRPVELSSLVLTRACRPVAGALVDLWQADDNGEYDNRGFRLRGHVFAEAEGRYAFRTWARERATAGAVLHFPAQRTLLQQPPGLGLKKGLDHLDAASVRTTRQQPLPPPARCKHRPHSQLEAAYHRADKAINQIVQLLAAA